MLYASFKTYPDFIRHYASTTVIKSGSATMASEAPIAKANNLIIEKVDMFVEKAANLDICGSSTTKNKLTLNGGRLQTRVMWSRSKHTLLLRIWQSFLSHDMQMLASRVRFIGSTKILSCRAVSFVVFVIGEDDLGVCLYEAR